MTTRRLAELVQEIWNARDPERSRKWLDGLTQSDVPRILMPAVCSRRLGIPAPSLRRDGQLERTDRFAPESEQPVLREWFRGGDGWAVVERLCTIAGGLKLATVAALQGTEAFVARRDVGQWAVGVVARCYWLHGTEPSAEQLDATSAAYRARMVVEGPLRRLRMSKSEFVAAVRTEWDARWPPDWPAAGFAPAELGLGSNRRPKLAGRGDWRAGTDRPLHRRYERYFDARSRLWRSDTEDMDPERHVTRRYLGAAKLDVALEEVDRSCRPIGLVEPAHAFTVAAVAGALRPASRRTGPGAEARGTDLDDWAASAPALPSAADPELVAAVAAYAVIWIANCRLAGELDLGGSRLYVCVVRRLWHFLHQREIEWGVPYRPGGAVELIKKCFGVHCRDEPPELPEETDAGPAPDPDPDEPPAIDRREQLTFNLINSRAEGRQLVQLLFDGDPVWRDAYATIVPVGPDYLTADEFLVLCGRYGVDPGES